MWAHVCSKLVLGNGVPTNNTAFTEKLMNEVIRNCCAEDLVFMGVFCKYDGASNLVNKQWIDIVFTIVDEFNEEYDGNGPVLYIQELKESAPLQDPVVNLV